MCAPNYKASSIHSVLVVFVTLCFMMFQLPKTMKPSMTIFNMYSFLRIGSTFMCFCSVSFLPPLNSCRSLATHWYLFLCNLSVFFTCRNKKVWKIFVPSFKTMFAYYVCHFFLVNLLNTNSLSFFILHLWEYCCALFHTLADHT